MDALQSRHRKELRDLQSRITQQKKQANKKTRKGVNDECDRLDAELKQRQESEISALNGERSDGPADLAAEAQSEDLALPGDGQDESPLPPAAQTQGPSPPASVVNEQDGTGTAPGKKPNRQKARLARRAAEQEEQAKHAAAEAQNLPDRKQQERERMLEHMAGRGLREHEIRADGHCLYSAVADQLDQLQIPLGAAPGGEPAVLPYKTVRAAAADYIARHGDDFAPFLDEPLPAYLHKVRDTAEWGGQLELTALAKTYGADIHVLQDFGRVERIEADGRAAAAADRVVWLGYYKHGFGLGEHYNSLRKVS